MAKIEGWRQFDVGGVVGKEVTITEVGVPLDDCPWWLTDHETCTVIDKRFFSNDCICSCHALNTERRCPYYISCDDHLYLGDDGGDWVWVNCAWSKRGIKVVGRQVYKS